jgi:hypothetical protein
MTGLAELSSQFYYTRHARERMTERKISKEQAQIAVLEPDSWHYGKDDEIIAVRKFGKRTIEVVYESLPEYVKVITVMVE